MSLTCGLFSSDFSRLQLKDVMFLFAFNIPLTVYSYALGHYLAKVQILEPQSAFQIRSRDTAVYCDSRSDSICPLSGANLQLCNWQKPSTIHINGASSMRYSWCDTGSSSPFTQSLPHIDPLIWPKDFELWFICPKDFILLPYCPVFVCHGPPEPFWHCFVSSTVVSWQQFCHVEQLHRVSSQ